MTVPRARRLTLVALALCGALTATAAPIAAGHAEPATPPVSFMGGGEVRVEPPASSPVLRAARQATEAEPQKYPFYPQAGTLWVDTYPVNFVDLDESRGIEDWDCSDYTYDGHNGHDTDIASFQLQDIGVPVFAALDGTVSHSNDGMQDRNTGPSNEVGNYVFLDHGGGHSTLYFHLRKDSVRAEPGDVIRAGAQIGLVGSSGNSSGPHLHFESQLNGVPYEPSAGRCRPGPSYWVDQIGIPDAPVAREVIFTEEPIEGSARPPWDEVTRTGTIRKGSGTFYFRVQMSSAPPRSTYRISLIPPRGTPTSFSGPFDNPKTLRSSYFWWTLGPRLVTGAWKLRMSINGQRLLQVPFRVVGRTATVSNRPPRPLSIDLLTTGDRLDDALICRVVEPALVRDPDYDVVSYEYTWVVDGFVSRSVRSAALSDMLPAGTATATSTVACEVTPSDGQSSGPTARATL